MERTGTQQLLDFIIEQELPLRDYKTLVKPLSEKFDIYLWQVDELNKIQKDAPKMLVNMVIRWEEGYQQNNLETTLNGVFKIKPKAT